MSEVFWFQDGLGYSWCETSELSWYMADWVGSLWTAWSSGRSSANKHTQNYKKEITNTHWKRSPLIQLINFVSGKYKFKMFSWMKQVSILKYDTPSTLRVKRDW